MGYCSIECEWFVFIKLHMTSLIHEYLALCRQLAKVQERCSAVMAEQAARTEGLERANLRLRARLVLQVTQWAWALEDAAVPEQGAAQYAVAQAAAEWVICQTGCISHDAYWRVQDHCRRTGRTCLLVDSLQAAALPAVVEVRVQRVLKVDS